MVRDNIKLWQKTVITGMAYEDSYGNVCVTIKPQFDFYPIAIAFDGSDPTLSVSMVAHGDNIIFNNAVPSPLDQDGRLPGMDSFGHATWLEDVEMQGGFNVDIAGAFPEIKQKLPRWRTWRSISRLLNWLFPLKPLPKRRAVVTMVGHKPAFLPKGCGFYVKGMCPAAKHMQLEEDTADYSQLSMEEIEAQVAAYEAGRCDCDDKGGNEQ